MPPAPAHQALDRPFRVETGALGTAGVTAAYGVVAWSFLVEIIGASLGASRWLLDTSILHHIARAPAADVRRDSAAILIAPGVTAAALGALAFTRRDLKGA